MHLPQQISYKLLISTSSSQDLTQSDEDVLLGKPPLELKEYDEEKGGLEEGESLCLQVELELGSSTCMLPLSPSLSLTRSRVCETEFLMIRLWGMMNRRNDGVEGDPQESNEFGESEKFNERNGRQGR